MPEFNIFIENIYPQFPVDDLKLHKDVIKMTEFIFQDEDIIKKSCLSDLKYSVISFDIVLSTNEKIHEINREYRDKDSPTDVITFAVFADSPEDERFIFDGEINLGEIIVSLDRIKEQATENNVSFEDEIYFIISHGILHLLGFDHLTEPEYNYMVEKQKEAKAVVL